MYGFSRIYPDGRTARLIGGRGAFRMIKGKTILEAKGMKGYVALDV